MYWLKTHKELIHFKSFFDEKKHLQKKLSEIIKKSIEMHEAKALKDNTHWRGLTNEDLEDSIVLVNIDEDALPTNERLKIFKQTETTHGQKTNRETKRKTT